MADRFSHRVQSDQAASDLFQGSGHLVESDSLNNTRGDRGHTLYPPSGDKAVDDVDNSVKLSSPPVTVWPKNGSSVTHLGAHSSGKPQVDTNSDRSIAPSVPADNAAVAPEVTGRDLAKAVLAASLAKATARGFEPGRRRNSTRKTSGEVQQSLRRRRWSGPGADARDPQPLGRLASRIAAEHGWNTRLTNGQVFGQWVRLVGAEVAEHAQPIALDEGELTVRASSTAWATQLRLLQAQLLVKIAAGVGNGVVKRMRIQGPAAPSWRKGPRHVSGRGPRDTYG